MEIGWELVFPVVTLPKLTLAGLALIPACACEPLRAITSGLVGALLGNEIDPEKFPDEAGLNTALNEADWPGWMVSGVASPEVLNPLPVTVN